MIKFLSKYTVIFKGINKVFWSFSLIVKIAGLFIIFNCPASFSSSVQDIHEDIGITSLMQSVASNDIEGVKFFIRINPLEINKRNIGGATALHIAVRNNNPEIVSALLQFNADVNTQDKEGWTPPMRACYLGYDEVFKLLVAKDVNISSLNNKSEGLIIQSAISGSVECMKITLAKIIPGRDFSVMDLKNQLSEAFKIASIKENQPQKEILLQYLDKLSNLNDQNYILNFEEKRAQKTVETGTFKIEEKKIYKKDENTVVYEAKPKPKDRDIVGAGSPEKYLDIKPEKTRIYILKKPQKQVNYEEEKRYQLISPDDIGGTFEGQENKKIYKLNIGKKKKKPIKKPKKHKLEDVKIKSQIIEGSKKATPVINNAPAVEFKATNSVQNQQEKPEEEVILILDGEKVVEKDLSDKGANRKMIEDEIKKSVIIK